MGEEVRDPDRTIPRAILIALSGAVAVYAIVALTLLFVLGRFPRGLQVLGRSAAWSWWPHCRPDPFWPESRSS